MVGVVEVKQIIGGVKPPCQKHFKQGAFVSLRAFLQLSLADRRAVMAEAGTVNVEAAQAAIARAVAAKAAEQLQQQPSPAQQSPSGQKLAPSPELPYNGGRNQAAPASPQPISLAAADAEKKPRAGKSETHAADPRGLFTAIITFNAFIPNTLGFKVRNSPVTGVQWGFVPGPNFLNYAFATDNRAKAGEPGTSRLSLILSINIDSTGHLHGKLSSAIPGLSHEIRVYDSAPKALKAAWMYEPGSQKRPERATVTNPEDKIYNQFSRTGRESIVDAKVSAGYPFSIIAPDIDLALHVVVNTDRLGHGSIEVTATSNAFPAYELLVNGSLAASSMPTDPGPSLFNLAGIGSSTLHYHKDF